MRMLVFLALAVVLACLPLGADAESPCPEGTFAIYVEDGILAGCEEFIGAPEWQNCSDDAVEGRLEDGTLAGCYSGSVSTEEECSPTGEDTDGDGWDDGCDPCLDNPDCDSDGFSDGIEGYIGTDPMDACSDDADDPAWPPDFDNDTDVDIVDVLKFKPAILSSVGDPNYNRRYDLSADGTINIVDVLKYKSIILATCSEAGLLLGGALLPVVEPLGAPFYFHLNSQRVRIHAEFRWTIAFPFPIPDWVRVKYNMTMGVEMVWLDFFNISAPTRFYCYAGDEWPFTLEPPWFDRVEPFYPGPAAWMFECKTRVWICPEIVFVGYPASVWIYWQIPGRFGGGVSPEWAFHKWWVYED